MKLVFATHNRHKVEEVAEILKLKIFLLHILELTSL